MVAGLGDWKSRGNGFLAVAGFKTDNGTVQVALTLPFENIEGAPGQVTVQASRVQFKVEAKSQSFQFDGQVKEMVLAGKVVRDGVSGTFELYRQMDPKALDRYMGFYQASNKRVLYVQPWDEMGGGLMYLDELGETRMLFATSESNFIAGSSALKSALVETRITFINNKSGEVTALRRQRSHQAAETLPRVSLYDQEDVEFNNGEVTLAGTLYLPKTPGPHPALILTHGSGGQNRTAGLLFVNSLLRRGIAILAYDKRGEGESTGSWLNSGFEDLAGDALAGVELLKSRKDMNPKQIGIWGLSQGGWIGPLAASLSHDIAFVIAVSAPATTPEQQELTRTEYEMRSDGYPDEDIQESLALYKLMNNYVRTGDGWEEYMAARSKAQSKPWGPANEAPSKDEPYFQFWRKIVDFDPVPVLEHNNTLYTLCVFSCQLREESAESAPKMTRYTIM